MTFFLFKKINKRTKSPSTYYKCKRQSRDRGQTHFIRPPPVYLYLWNDFWPLLSNRAWTGTPFDPQFHIISLRSVWSFAFLTFVPDFLASNVTWEWSGDAPSCHHPLMQIPVGRKFIIEIISLELCWIKQAKRCLIRELKLRLGDTVVANPKTWHIYQKKIPYALSKVYFFLPEIA